MTTLFKRLSLAALLIVTGCGRGEDGGSSRKAIQNKGSDTLVNIAQAWAEAYREINPSIAVAVTGGGSGTGIAALINGTVDIANASRAMKDSEKEQARNNGEIDENLPIDGGYEPEDSPAGKCVESLFSSQPAFDCKKSK